MANRLKGITLEIGGDVTKLSKALSGVNSDIINTKQQLKDVERLLKLDPTNVDLLRQKEQLLNKEIGSTKDKLDQLNQAQKTMDANGVDKTSEQYMALQREINETEQSLKRLKEESVDFGGLLSQQFSSVGDKIENVGNKISDVGEKISGVGKKMLPATAVITGLGAASFNSASDMAESANKVEVAFGDASERVKSFADTTLDSYGIAKGTAMDMAAQFGDMATSMELSHNAAADMSIGLVGLAGDLASFKNIGIDQAMSALNGVFTGETESLKSFGIVMTQTNLLQFAITNGFINTAKSAEQLKKEQLALEKAQIAYNESVKKYGENSIQAQEAGIKLSEAQSKLTEGVKASLDSLSQAEQVQLRYAYVMNATANAQGDFARTSDGAANSIRIMQESTKEASAAFGELLLPIITPIIQQITLFIKALRNLDEGQKKVILTILAVIAAIGPILIIIGTVTSGIGAIVSGIGGFLGGIGMLIEKIPLVISALSSAGKAIGALIPIVMQFNAALAANPYLLLAVAIAAAVALIAAAIIANFDAVKAAAQALLDWLTTGFQQMLDVIKTILTVFAIALAIPFVLLWALAKTTINALLSLVETGINNMIAMLNALISVINAVISAIASLAGLSFRGFGSVGNVRLPRLARGGEVFSGTALVGEAGPELLTVSGGRAIVTPLTDSQRTSGASAAMAGSSFRTEVGVTFTGSLSQLAAVLQPYIVAETKRLGGSFTR